MNKKIMLIIIVAQIKRISKDTGFCIYIFFLHDVEKTLGENLLFSLHLLKSIFDHVLTQMMPHM